MCTATYLILLLDTIMSVVVFFGISHVSIDIFFIQLRRERAGGQKNGKILIFLVDIYV